MTGLAIVGMHRSGTSVVARVAHGMGLVPGGTLMDARSENARGFFERDDVTSLDNRWLGRLGGAWEAPPRTTLGDWAALDTRQLRSDRDSLDILSPDHPPWFVKDPRISLLLPLWDRLSLQRLPAVLAVRDPLESAGSVWLRDGFTPRRSLALWYLYTHQAATALGEREALVIDYGTLVRRPEQAVEGLAAFITTTVGRVIDLPTADLNRLVEPGLRRQDGRDLPRLPREYVDDARDLHAAVAAVHAVPEPTFTLPPLPGWVDEVWDELRELVELRRSVQTLTSQRDVLAGRVTVRRLAPWRRKDS